MLRGVLGRFRIRYVTASMMALHHADIAVAITGKSGSCAAYVAQCVVNKALLKTSLSCKLHDPRAVNKLVFAAPRRVSVTHLESPGDLHGYFLAWSRAIMQTTAYPKRPSTGRKRGTLRPSSGEAIF